MPRRGRVDEAEVAGRLRVAAAATIDRAEPLDPVPRGPVGERWSGGRPALPGRRRARAVVGGRSLGLRQRLGVRATRSAPKNTRYGCCVGVEVAMEAVEQDRGAAVGDGKRSRQSLQGVGEAEVRDEQRSGAAGGDGVVRGTGTTIASSGASSSTERLSIPAEASARHRRARRRRPPSGSERTFLRAAAFVDAANGERATRSTASSRTEPSKGACRRGGLSTSDAPITGTLARSACSRATASFQPGADVGSSRTA